MSIFRFSRIDFFLTCLGLVFLVLDVVLDTLTAVEFFREGELVRLSVLVVLLVGSSLLVQIYSWLWYKYDGFLKETAVERAMSLTTLKALHVLQLGTYVRHIGVMEMAVRKLYFSNGRGSDPGDVAVYLSHDVAMLRIVETFSESAPQLVLMVTIYIQQGHLHVLPALKFVGSALAVSLCVTSYHRSLRHFMVDKRKQSIASSAVYFLWNLLLIAARVASLSLFAAMFPCFILPHFLCSWVLLVMWAWREKTDFMGGNPCGERLYRATVGLIWYFNSFNVKEGRTFWRALLYHGYILLDMVLLVLLWFWKMNPDLPNFNYEHLLAILCIISVYIFGLLVKSIYYYCFHPNITKEDLKTVDNVERIAELESPVGTERSAADEIDAVVFRSAVPEPSRDERKVNKRMMNLAKNFYS